jgi:glucosamine--fructose-6-phosphate aminotransferase (isomerizing)
VSLLLQDIGEQADLLRTVLDRTALAEARELLGRRSVVRLAGIGSSRHVAAYGAACLEALGDRFASVLASPGRGVPQPAGAPDQVLVLVSQSGATPALVELAVAARAAGSAVVLLSNSPGALLEDLSDVVLHCGAGPERVVPATKSVTTSMLVLRALAAPVSGIALGDCAGAVDHLVASGVAAGPAVPCFVVAGGLAGQAVADEVALKLAEVAGLAVVPESVVDYLHGPAAVRAPVVALVDPDDPNRLALLDRPDVHAVDVPRCGDATLDRITQVVAGQLMAASWAERLGVDPDDPKGLAKVTLTA